VWRLFVWLEMLSTNRLHHSFEIALVLVRLDHVASFIVNSNHFLRLTSWQLFSHKLFNGPELGRECFFPVDSFFPFSDLLLAEVTHWENGEAL
jgi:hypothetical protein